MKPRALLLAIIFSLLTLMSCTHSYTYLRADLTRESWIRFVSTNPNLWTRGADRWFLTGEPNAMEMAYRRAGDAMSTKVLNVCQFTQIKTNGNFQLQIFGTNGPNTAYIYGPKGGIGNINVSMLDNHTLFINQQYPRRFTGQMIVRIGVNQLTSLIQTGTGLIEGYHLQSNGLSIISHGGSIYLSGDINLRKVISTGGGKVTVIGANSPCLDIFSNGPSCINICGKVGVRYIVHHGTGDINIIGANSGALNILANGKGKISVLGTANLHDVRALGSAAVFVTNVQSSGLSVYVSKQATVGLAGRTCDLYLVAKGAGNFLGRNLCVLNAYVKTSGTAHANVNVSNKIFASARDESSIFFFGRPKKISQFMRDNAAIITLVDAERSTCC